MLLLPLFLFIVQVLQLLITRLVYFGYKGKCIVIASGIAHIKNQQKLTITEDTKIVNPYPTPGFNEPSLGLLLIILQERMALKPLWVF